MSEGKHTQDRPVERPCREIADRITTLTTQRDKLVKALQFYADAWNCKPNKRYGYLEWSPKEELLDDCGNKAKEALSQTKEGV